MRYNPYSHQAVRLTVPIARHKEEIEVFKMLTSSLRGEALPCYVISHEPLIIVSYWQDFFSHKEAFASYGAAGKPVYLFAMLGWHRETPERATELAAEVQAVAAIAPAVRPVFLGNSLLEEELLVARGLSCVYCHQNAFLDERRYRVQHRAKKQYQAIYVARITPFKRHELAAEIASLSLVGSWHIYEQDYQERVIQTLAHAKWRRKVPSFMMYRYMNAAHTGLCLSAEEGAMFVSAEYLLCGLPIVSTANLGGRDGLFTAPYALTTEPNAQAVAAAVEWQIGQRHDPLDIRHAVIEKMHRHRDTFVALVQAVYDAERLDRDFASEWAAVYTHKLGIRCSVPLPRRWQRRLLKPLAVSHDNLARQLTV